MHNCIKSWWNNRRRGIWIVHFKVIIRYGTQFKVGLKTGPLYYYYNFVLILYLFEALCDTARNYQIPHFFESPAKKNLQAKVVFVSDQRDFHLFGQLETHDCSRYFGCLEYEQDELTDMKRRKVFATKKIRLQRTHDEPNICTQSVNLNQLLPYECKSRRQQMWPSFVQEKE